MFGTALTRNFEKGTLVPTLSVDVESQRENLSHIILTTKEFIMIGLLVVIILVLVIVRLV